MLRFTTLGIAACWLLSAEAGAAGRDCLGCHPSAGSVLSGPMATRAGERA